MDTYPRRIEYKALSSTDADWLFMLSHGLNPDSYDYDRRAAPERGEELPLVVLDCWQ